MASKATINRQKSSEKVIAACNTHASGVENALGSLYGADVGQAAGVLVKTFSQSLRALSQKMVEMDDANEAELRDDDPVRTARDAAAEKLYEHLCTTRNQLKTVCGTKYVSALGFKGDTPSDPVEILRLSEVVLENLKQLEAPTSQIPGYTFDPTVWTTPLFETVGTLKTALSQTATEAREAETALIAKRQAIAAYDVAFSRTAGLVSTFLEMAGETDLAKRVRPSSRRPGQTAETAPAEGTVSVSE